MTKQTTDRIQYEGKEYLLAECPLESHGSAATLLKLFVTQSTGNWRGYSAEWSIKKDGWLHLTQIDGILSINGECREAELSDIAPGSVDAPLATWFTGILNLSEGRQIESVSEYDRNIQARTIRLTFLAGQIQNVEVVHTGQALEITSWPRRC